MSQSNVVIRLVWLLAGLLPSLPALGQAPDLPPIGRSLFDQLTVDGGGLRRVPFPFPALMERVRREVGPDMLGHAGVRSVLIPLGRSLQRNASVAEAYRFPRVVAAVVGEPRPGAPLLRDRLYLGYHEKAGVLEVISYNDEAGRFEFQVVKDYRPGGASQVFQARRTVCLSCHHGAAPIFSRPGWDETNANPRVAAQLKRGGSDFHGVPAARSIDEPNAIDNAVARANRFDLTQRIWREGCAPSDAVDCRAQALLAALKYRLGGDTSVDATATAYRSALLAPLRSAGLARWPDGLPLPDPSIPNRDPLAGFPVDRTDFGDGAALLRTADVRPAFDPLQPRSPLGHWHAESEYDVASYVRGVAQFIAPVDIQAIDRRLQALRTAAYRRVVRTTCRVDDSTRAVALKCASAEPGKPSVRVDIRLVRGDGEGVTGSMSGVSVAGGTLARSLELRPITGQATRSSRQVWSYRGEPVRLSDATAIEGVMLRWSASEQPAAEVELRLADDTPTLMRAIDGLARQARSGLSDALGEAPIRRRALVRGLFSQLGIAAQSVCCVPPRGAQAMLDLDDARSPDELPAQVRTFVRHCAACHDTREDSPPGFLRGSADEVMRNLSRCAERISYRLNMWELAAEERPRVPMPPPLANGVAVAPPPRDDILQMREYVARLAGPTVRRDLPYEALAVCRPDLP